ncbi:MAG: hypothetical protein AAF411_21130 [Myxococcota bacterium]
MTRLDTTGLRAWMAREWAATRDADRRARAAQTPKQKVRLAVELYESAKRSNPAWPTAEDRARDLRSHERLRALLTRAAHVGAR